MTNDELTVIDELKAEIHYAREQIAATTTAVAESTPLLAELNIRLADWREIRDLSEEETAALLLPAQLVLLNYELTHFEQLLLETKNFELN